MMEFVFTYAVLAPLVLTRDGWPPEIHPSASLVDSSLRIAGRSFPVWANNTAEMQLPSWN